jgi:hypothetical protein
MKTFLFVFLALFFAIALANENNSGCGKKCKLGKKLNKLGNAFSFTQFTNAQCSGVAATITRGRINQW